MPSIWVTRKEYEDLMRIKTTLEKVYKKDVGMSQVISSLIEATSIPAEAGKDEEIIKKLKVMRNIVKRRVEKSKR